MQPDRQAVQERTGFVGRVQEQRQFLVALQGLLAHHQRWMALAEKLGSDFDIDQAPADNSYANIFILHGIGGIGKTWLAQRFLLLAEGMPNEPPILTLYDDVSLGSPVLEPLHLLDRLADLLAQAGYDPYLPAYREARAAIGPLVEAVTRFQFEHRMLWEQLLDTAAELVKQDPVDSAHLPFHKISLAYTHASGVESSGRDAPTLTRAYDLLLQEMKSDAELDDFEIALFRNPAAALASRLVSGLKQATLQHPVVICIDNLEIIVPLEPFVRDCLVLPTTQAPLIWILSGRHNLADERLVTVNGENRVYKGYRDLLGANPPVAWDMSIFGDADLREYLEAESDRRHTSLLIDEDIIDAIKVTSSGVPLVVEMVTDALFAMDRDEFLREFALDDRSLLAGDRLNTIAERFLRYCLTQPEDLERVQALALLSKDADAQAMAAVWRLRADQSLSDILYTLHTRYAFVTPAGLHDAVYEFVRHQLRTSWQTSEARTRLGQRAVTFYQARWDELQARFDEPTLRIRDAGWQRATRDLLNALLWVDPDRAVLFLLPRFVEGLGFDRAFSSGLLRQAEEFLTDAIIPFSDSYASLLHRMRVGLQNIDWTFAEPGEAIGVMLGSLLDLPGLSPLHLSILSLWQGNWLADHGQLDEALDAYQRADAFLPESAAGLRRQLGKAFFEISSRFVWPTSTAEPVPSETGLQAAARAVDLDPGQGPAWYNYGVALDYLGQPEQAVEAYRRAIELTPKPAYYNDLGEVYSALQRDEDAVSAYQQAIALDSTYAWPYHNLGILYADRGQLADAIKYFQQAIELHEHDRDRAVSWDSFGDAQVLLGNYEEAITAYRWSGLLNPRFASPWYGLGHVYQLLKRYREAKDAFHKVLTLNPQHAWAFHMLGSLFARDEDYNLAVSYLERAIEHHDADADKAASWRKLGAVYSIQGQHRKALEACRQAITLDASQPEIWNSLGDVHVELNNWEAAINAYQEAVRLRPDFADSWDSMGDVYRLQGRFKEAIEAYEHIIRLESGDAWPYHYLAEIYGRMGDFERARDFYRQAIERHNTDRDQAASLTGLGDVYVALDDPEQAIESYQTAIDRAPDYAWSYHKIAEIYADLGRERLAIANYRQAIEHHSTVADRVVSWFQLADVYHQLGSYEDAIDAYRQVIVLGPADGEAWNNLGDSYLALEKFGEAAESYRQAIRLDPNYASPYHGLGVLAADAGDNAAALAYYQQAIERHEDDQSRAISYYKLGDTYLVLARPELAETAFRQAIHLSPNFAHPYHNLGAMAEQRGDYQTALRLYQQAVDLYPAEVYSERQALLWTGLGNVYRALEQPANAVEAYEQAIEFDSTLSPPWNSLGDMHRLQGNARQAAKCYKQAIKLDPALAQSYHNLGLIAESEGEYEAAINYFRDALERYPAGAVQPRARCWGHLGNAQRSLNQIQAALEAYRQAIQLDGYYFQAEVNLGDLYANLQRYNEAVAAYQRAVAIDPSQVAPWSRLADTYRTLERYGEASNAYQQAVELDETEPDPYYGLGIIDLTAGDHATAIEYFEKAISRFRPDQQRQRALAWNGLGDGHRLQQSYPSAIDAYQQAIRLDDSLPEPHHSLGLIYYNTAQFELAIAQFRQALERYPVEVAASTDRAVVRTDLGDAYSALRRWDPAVEAYQRAIELDSNLARPWLKLGDVYRVTGQPDEAIKAYRAAVDLDPGCPWVYNNLGLAYQHQQDASRAEAAFQQAIERHTRAVDQATSWYNLGDVYLAQDRLDEALHAFEQSIHLNPSFARPWKGLGDVYRAQGRTEGIVAAYQQAINLDPDYSWPYHSLGVVYKNQGAHSLAITYYQQAIDRHQADHDRAVSWNGLGSVHLATGQYGRAVEAFQKAIQLNPTDAWPYHNLAFVNKRLGAYQEAIGLYLKAIERFENDQHRAISWNNLGNVYTGLERGGSAIKAYRTAIDLDNEYALPWNSLGEVYLRQGQYEEAVNAFQEAIERDEHYVLAWNNLGDAYWRQRRFDRAIRAYGQAIALDERYAWPYHNLGLLYDERGDYELALENYQAAIDRHDNAEQQAVLSEKMGDLHRIMGATDKAIEFFRNATVFDPTYAAPWYTLGNIYAGLGQDDEADRAYRHAIQLKPDEPWSYHNLALVYEQQGILHEAIILYQQAIARHQTDRGKAVSWDNLGNVYRDANRLEDSVQAFREAIRLNPDYALPWNSLGDIYTALRNYTDAADAYQRAIALDPDYVWAYNSLGSVYINMNEHDLAIEIFQQVIERSGDIAEVAVSWTKLGDIYDALQREKEAILAYEQAIELDPDLIWPYNRLGAIYERQGDRDQAFALYQQATWRHRQRTLAL